MYMYCGKKVYTADTLHINGMLVGRKELLEYKLNSRYSIEKYGNLCECINSNVTARTADIMRSLIHYVKVYFNNYEYSSSNVEKLQLKILNDLDGRSGVLVSPYVIRNPSHLFLFFETLLKRILKPFIGALRIELKFFVFIVKPIFIVVVR